MAIMSVARLRAIIDRLERACDIERLGFIPDDCGLHFIETSSKSGSASTTVGAGTRTGCSSTMPAGTGSTAMLKTSSCSESSGSSGESCAPRSRCHLTTILIFLNEHKGISKIVVDSQSNSGMVRGIGKNSSYINWLVPFSRCKARAGFPRTHPVVAGVGKGLGAMANGRNREMSVQQEQKPC